MIGLGRREKATHLAKPQFFELRTVLIRKLQRH
jgi:hypothetical protein